jgi:hypothetical protein
LIFTPAFLSYSLFLVEAERLTGSCNDCSKRSLKILVLFPWRYFQKALFQSTPRVVTFGYHWCRREASGLPEMLETNLGKRRGMLNAVEFWREYGR